MATKPTTQGLDSHMNIRVNARKHQRFAKVCEESDIDASAVLRSLMDEVVTRGIAYDPNTGKPTIR